MLNGVPCLLSMSTLLWPPFVNVNDYVFNCKLDNWSPLKVDTLFVSDRIHIIVSFLFLWKSWKYTCFMLLLLLKAGQLMIFVIFCDISGYAYTMHVCFSFLFHMVCRYMDTSCFFLDPLLLVLVFFWGEELCRFHLFLCDDWQNFLMNISWGSTHKQSFH